jgi:transposase-like protein
MSQQDDTLRAKLQQHLGEQQEEGAQKDVLRDLVEWLVQELLNLEFDQFLGAERYERSEGREGYRNGYRQRDLVTRVGRLTLLVPRDREGRFSTQLFERYQRSEKALVLALQESYLQGVSTRKVRHITEKLCGVEFSKDQVSSMTQALDEELGTWRQRSLPKTYPYLVADARYEYVREDGRVESEGVLTVKGIDQEGYREILSVVVAPGEDEASWAAVFSDLLDRGLDPKAVRLVVSDEHRGLHAALRRYFPGAGWQRCQTHYQRNAGAKVAKRVRTEVHRQLRDIFAAPDPPQANERARQMIEAWQDRSPELASWLEETIEAPLAVFSIPAKHQRRMRTTNGLERYQQEIRRRSRVIRIFPNRASCLRLTTALGMEQSEEWLTGHKYLDMSALDEHPVEMVTSFSLKKENELSSFT